MPLFFRLIHLSAIASSLCIAEPLEYSAVKKQNPLTGFVPFAANYGEGAFPHTMEFFYIPLRDLMKSPTTYDWSSLDDKLQEIASRNHQSIFRVYLDYPKTEMGIPEFILRGADGIANTADDLKTNEYNDYGNKTSRSPDYDHPFLRTSLRSFIAELGKKYDKDPRIAFIKLGLLGFWGEWHTYPHNGENGEKNFSPSLAVQEEILAAYQEAFHNTLLLVREPKADFFKKYSIGYHDDSFAYQTLSPPSWHFEGKLTEHNEQLRWKTNVIAGEIRPEIQPEIWENPKMVPNGQEYDRCVNRIHPSWLLAAGSFNNRLSPRARKLAEKQALRLGYEFYLTSAVIEAKTNQKEFSISTTLRNTGIAPFYYDWPIEIGFLDFNNKLAHTMNPDWEITGLLPGEADRNWIHTCSAPAALEGKYQVVLRVVNPLAHGIPLLFANETQDKHLSGWLSLGDVQF